MPQYQTPAPNPYMSYHPDYIPKKQYFTPAPTPKPTPINPIRKIINAVSNVVGSNTVGLNVAMALTGGGGLASLGTKLGSTATKGFLSRIGSKIGSFLIPKMGFKDIFGRLAVSYGIGEGTKAVSSAISGEPYSPKPTRQQILSSLGFGFGSYPGLIAGTISGLTSKVKSEYSSLFGIRPQFANASPYSPNLAELGRDIYLRNKDKFIPTLPQEPTHFSDTDTSITPPIGYIPSLSGGSISPAPSNIFVSAGGGGSDFGLMSYLLMGGLAGGGLGYLFGRRRRKKRKKYKGRRYKKR